MGQTRDEQETIVRWDEATQAVHVYSASPRTWRRAAKLGLVVAREVRQDGVITGRFYAPVPLAKFRWGLKRAGVKGNPEALRRARSR